MMRIKGDVFLTSEEPTEGKTLSVTQITTNELTRLSRTKLRLLRIVKTLVRGRLPIKAGIYSRLAHESEEIERILKMFLAGSADLEFVVELTPNVRNRMRTMQAIHWKTEIPATWKRALDLKDIRRADGGLVVEVEEESGKRWFLKFDTVQAWKVTSEECAGNIVSELPAEGALFLIRQSGWLWQLGDAEPFKGHSIS